MSDTLHLLDGLLEGTLMKKDPLLFLALVFLGACVVAVWWARKLEGEEGEGRE